MVVAPNVNVHPLRVRVLVDHLRGIASEGKKGNPYRVCRDEVNTLCFAW